MPQNGSGQHWNGQCRSAREGYMRDAVENVEAFGRLAGDRIGHELSGYRSEHKAQSGIALREIGIWSEPTEMRQAVVGQRHLAVPEMRQLCFSQLRKIAQHGTVKALTLSGVFSADHAVAASEDQPVVRCQPPGIDDVIAVPDADAFGQNGASQLVRKRLGCDHCTGDRDHAPGHARHKSVKICVACKTDIVATNQVVAIGSHPRHGAGVDPDGGCGFEYAHTGSGGDPGQTCDQIESVNMTATFVQKAADYAFRSDNPARFLGVQQADMVVAMMSAFGQLCRQPGHVAWLGGYGQMPVCQVAIQIVFFDLPRKQIQSFDRHGPQTIRVVGADHVDYFGLQTVEAWQDVAAASSRGASADPRCFDKGDIVAAFGQFDGGRQAGYAAADNANIRLDVAIHGRIGFAVSGSIFKQATGWMCVSLQCDDPFVCAFEQSSFLYHDFAGK